MEHCRPRPPGSQPTGAPRFPIHGLHATQKCPFFSDLDSSGLTTPGDTPDLPFLASDVLWTGRGQGAAGDDGREHPLLSAPHTLSPSSLLPFPVSGFQPGHPFPFC